MPFNGSGTFTIVNTFIPNTTILSSAVNANFTDIATGLSDCLTRDGQAGMTAAFKAIAGTAGAPSISFTSDTKSGMYLISAGNLGLTANGALALELNQFQVAQFQQAAEAKLWCVVDTASVSTSSNINTIATAGTGSIAIGTSTTWATNGYLIAGNEVMSYTVASANGLTINTRGDMGTTSVSHSTGSTITPLLTSVAAKTLLLPARATAARSTAPAPGEFAYNTGSGGLEHYNGTAWVADSPPQIVPQGYLSPTAGVPIITGDAVSQGTIFYNPYTGNQIPIPTNGTFTLQTFTTASIALSASQAVNGIYDVYGFISTTNSTLTFGFGPSWSAGTSGSVTAGSCARGTGTGGADVTRLNGVYVNTTSMTILNGASSYSIATASGLYVGSVFISSTTAGTVNLHRSYGQNRTWGIWNAHNKQPIYLKAGDATASWSLTTGTTWRPSNNTTANSLVIFSGLAEDVYETRFTQNWNRTGSSANAMQAGVGVNSTSSPSGFQGVMGYNVVLTSQTNFWGSSVGTYTSPPLLGINVLTALEQTISGAQTISGTEANMVFKAAWRA